MSSELVNIKKIKNAYNRISKYVHKTPVFTSSAADKMTGRKCFFKAENLQKTGSFKVRGALNAILALKEKNPNVSGVVTHSSGNHGQAVAWATSVAGFPCSVVVPEYAPEVKKTAIRGYGAELAECGSLPTDRNVVCDKISTEKGYVIIPPYDHEDVIAGQGTVALELLDQVPDLDAILVSVSGGGLSSGIAIAAKAIKPNIKIFLVEPEGKHMEKCLREGKRLWSDPPKYLDTIADGIRLEQPGQLTFPILTQLVEKEVFSLNNDEMIEGMKFAFQRMKLVIEAAAGAAVAAILSDKMKKMDPSLKHVAVILCGGNIDIDHLPWY
ncbi:probable serine racemase [Gigantopelta aegis]|uniref:probable serine racemase n=1 Tax=Gigantopelta aegis TaxID=1735272 RepID=UPI001B88C5BE|nr:probable serine racemase [Gigantopelta aegis]